MITVFCFFFLFIFSDTWICRGLGMWQQLREMTFSGAPVNSFFSYLLLCLYPLFFLYTLFRLQEKAWCVKTERKAEEKRGGQAFMNRNELTMQNHFTILLPSRGRWTLVRFRSGRGGRALIGLFCLHICCKLGRRFFWVFFAFLTDLCTSSFFFLSKP